jgi:hypothetical protein
VERPLGSLPKPKSGKANVERLQVTGIVSRAREARQLEARHPVDRHVVEHVLVGILEERPRAQVTLVEEPFLHAGQLRQALSVKMRAHLQDR